MDMIDILAKLREYEKAGHNVADAVKGAEMTQPEVKQEGGMSDIHIGAQEIVGDYVDDDGNLKMPKVQVIADMDKKKRQMSFPKSYEYDVAMDMVRDDFDDGGARKPEIDSITNAPVSEDANEQEIIQYAKKYSQYKNLENDNLIEALYNFYLKDGIPQFMFEKGELASAEQKLGKKQDTWTGEEIEEAQKMSPITMGLINDLNKMIPGDSMEEKLEKMRPTLDKAGMLESYAPFPEADEFNIEAEVQEKQGVDHDKDGDIDSKDYLKSRDIAIKKAMGKDINKKDDMKKENVKEDMHIMTDSPEEMGMMMQILKLAGVKPVDAKMMGAEEPADETELANSPAGYTNDQKVQSIDDLVNVHSGGLNRQKVQVKKGHPGDNELTAEDLANSLTAQYESFKNQYQAEATKSTESKK